MNKPTPTDKLLVGYHGPALGDPEHGPTFRYGGGYIATIKPRDSATFLSMSRQAGANVDYGTAVLGGRLTWGPASIGAIEYYTQDTLNIAYVEGKYGGALPWDLYSILALQYADQRTVGANLTNGGNYYQTSQFGTRLEIGKSTGILTLGFSTVGPNFAMMNPWSANPIYTDAQIQGFQRAGENALMVGLSYVMTPIGLPGVAASVFYYNGWTSAAAATCGWSEPSECGLPHRDWPVHPRWWHAAPLGQFRHGHDRASHPAQGPRGQESHRASDQAESGRQRPGGDPETTQSSTRRPQRGLHRR
jgi:hypothetical protein